MVTIYFIFVTIFLLVIVVESTIIHTLSGPIRGQHLKEYNVSFFSYQGIPYAEPPTGSYRFKPPLPRKRFSEVFDATKDGPVCPQPIGRYSKSQMNEDCLNLNVYVPECDLKALFPVVVHVPGGEFKSLSGRGDIIYGPQLFLKRNVILVTLNYRLGPLGFLSVQTDAASGNAGIKDVLLALKWVKSNIRLFGGDPDNITLGGNSAGGVIVHYLLLSNQSTGLFQKSYLISGSALGYRFLNRYPLKSAVALSNQLGLECNDTDEIVKNLQEADPFDIIDAAESLGTNNDRNGLRPFSAFVPVVEPMSPHAIITKSPFEIIKSGMPQKVPIISGFNAQEGIKMLPVINKNSELVDKLNENFELCIPPNIEYPYGSQESKTLARAIRRFYLAGKDITNTTLSGFVKLVSDTQFTYSVDSWIKAYKNTEQSNALYYYVFNFDGDFNWFKIINNVTFNGTAHADELGYFFVTNATKSILNKSDEESQQTMDIILTLWTNFFKYGHPTSNHDSRDIDEWVDCGEQRNNLLLNSSPKMVRGYPIRKRLDFWYKVYEDYENYLKNGGVIQEKLFP